MANESMDGVLEQYTLMESSIAIEEEATKKKKKIYEDLF